jgi:hypothetical protein
MSRMLLAFVVGGTACAQAHNDASLGGRPDAGGITVHDSNNGGDDDSSTTPDAPMQHPDGTTGGGTMTLTQTMDQTVAVNNSLGCGSSGGIAQNSYYRVFPLSDFNISGPFSVTNVTFKVEYASSSPAATVIVGTYAGTPTNTLTKSSITPIQTVSNVAIPDADADQAAMPGTVDVPISATIPAGSNVLVEVDVPAGTGFFYVGTSTGGETKPGYISTASTATGCNPPGATPTSMTSVAGTQADILLTVTGTY